MRNFFVHSRCIFVLLLIVSNTFFVGNAFSQNKSGTDEKPFHLRLVGRAFFDAGFFMDDTLDFGNTFQVNDLRLGAVVSFLDNWEAKLELGYGNNKITFKDVFLGYKYNGHLFRLGYQFEPFGNARIGTTNYRFMQNAASDAIFGNGRKLGISYSYNRKYFNVMAGVYSAADIQSSSSDKMDEGYSIAAKFIGRPLVEEGKLLHIAVAPRFSDDKDIISFKGGVPTALLSKSKNGLLDCSVDGVINQWKVDFEGIMLYNRWYFQGQYYLVHLNRELAENFTGKGGYAQMGFLIIGNRHNYNQKTGMVVNPSPKTLECLVRYDNINLNDSGVRGGRLENITLGLNYFINKYIGAKLNYTKMLVGETAAKGGDFDLIQARLQFSF